MIVSAVGMFSSVLQKFVSYKYKDNVSLNIVQLSLETSIIFSSVIFIFMFNNTNYNTLISDTCSPYMEIPEKTDIDHMYTMRNPR